MSGMLMPVALVTVIVPADADDTTQHDTTASPASIRFVIMRFTVVTSVLSVISLIPCPGVLLEGVVAVHEAPPERR